MVGYSRVTAATAGVIGDVPVRVGDRITRSTLLTTHRGQLGPRALSERARAGGAAAEARACRCELLDETGRTIATERINFISPSVDDATQTVLVKTPVSARGGAVPLRSVRARQDRLVHGARR